MNKRFTKLISLLLALVMVVGMIPGNVFAAGQDPVQPEDTDVEVPFPTEPPAPADPEEPVEEEDTIVLGERFSCTISEEGTYYEVPFTPGETGWYMFVSYCQEDTYGSILLADGTEIISDDDGDYSNNFNVRAYLYAGTEYILRAKFYSANRIGSFEAAIYGLEEITLDEMREVTLSPSNAVEVFSFTPAESGVYSFYADTDDSVISDIRVREAGTYRENTSNMQSQINGYRLCQMNMEAGRAYALYVGIDSYRELTFGVTVTKTDAEAGYVSSVDSINAAVYGAGNIELYPESVSVNILDMPEITWEVGNEEIVELSENGAACRYTLLAAGSTVITATVGDQTFTIPVTVVALPALTLDQEVEAQAVPENYEPIYTFIAPEDGVYGFYTYHNYEEPYGLNVEVIVNGLNWMSGGSIPAWDNINELQLELEAGDVCNIRLMPWTGFALTAYLGVTKCPDATDVVFDPNSVVGYPTGWNSYTQVDYAVYPVHANLRGMTWGTSDEELVEVSDWNRQYAHLRLHKVGNGTIGLILSSGTFELPVQILDYPVLELNTEVEVTSQRYDDSQIYLFTAPEAGVYSFYTLCENNQPGNSMQIAVEDPNGQTHYGNYYAAWGTKDVQLELAEGETCKVRFYSGSGNSANTSMVGAVKAPVPTSVSIDTDQVERYISEADESYRIVVTAQPAHADLTNITWESGNESVVTVNDYGAYCEYTVQGIGETVITVTYGNSVEEIPVVVKEVPTMELDMPVRVEDIVSGEPLQFTFTPTESGMYTFYSVSDDNEYRVELTVASEYSWHSSTYYEDWGTEDIMVYMEAGETYSLKAHCYYGNRAISGSVCLIRSPEATSLTVDVQSISGYADISWTTITARSQPAHSYMSNVVWTSDNTEVVKVESHGQSCNYLLVQPGNANIIVTAGDATYTIPVEVKAKRVLQEGIPQSVTCVTRDDDVYFDFTPTESGVYTFYHDNLQGLNMSVYTDNWYYGQISEAWGCEYVQKYLQAGDTYSVFIYNTWSGQEQTGNVCVVKAPAATALTATQSSISGYASNAWMNLPVSVEPRFAQLGELTVSSGNEEVVLVEANATSISYQLVAPGSTEITVTMGEATLTIPVEVTSIPSVELDEVFICDITTSGQEVYRSFTPAVSGYYMFTRPANDQYLDTYGTIYDENMNWIAENDDGGGNGSFAVVTYLEAGRTYYLGARLYGVGLNSFDAVISTLEVQQLVAGEQQIAFESQDPYYYSYTAETAGTYAFYINSQNVEVRVNGSYYTPGYNEAWGSRDYFMYLDAGDSCMFTLQTYETGMNVTVGMIPAVEATSIGFERDEVSGFAGAEGSVRVITMPAHSTAPDISWASSDPAVVDVGGGNASCWYVLRSVGTAQITATVGGTVYTLPVTVNEIPTIAAGETAQHSLRNGEQVKYKFIPAETGVYSFYAEDVSEGMISLVINDEHNEWLTNGQAYGPGYVDPSSDAQYELEAGKTYYLVAQANWVEYMDCTLGIVKAPEVTGITLDWQDGMHEYYLPGETYGNRVTAMVSPAHADVTELEWNVTDEDVVSIEYCDSDYCSVVITGAGTAQLTVTAGNGVSATMDIEIRETPDLELGETYECVYDENYNRQQFLFTPETTGLYHAYTAGESSTQIWLYELVQYEDWLETYQIGHSSYGADGSNALLTQRLEAGKTYLYYVEEHWNEESFTFRITDPEPVSRLRFYDDAVFGFPGESQWLNYKLEPFTADESSIQLVSSDDAVVTVQENGSILLVGAGTATLTATAASGVSDTCTVTVKEPLPLTLNSQKAVTVIPELNCEQFYFIPDAAGTYTVEATGAFGPKFLYASSENGIDVGNEGNGNVKIQFTAEAGERVDIILEAYYGYPADFTVKVTSPNAATGISFAQSSISGMVHSIAKLNVKFAPAGAAEEEITWSSNNESVATVEYGYVTIVGAGTAVITAETESGLTAHCTVTGTEPETITVSETKKVDVEVPGDTGVFKFVPESTTTYVVRSIGNAQTALEILDEDGNYVGAVNYALRAAYGIIGESGDVVELEAGKTYYVRATMASNAIGAFKVIIEEHLRVVDFEITQLPYQTECYRDGEISMSGLELKVEWSDGSFTDYSYDEGGDLGDDGLSWGTSVESSGKEIELYIGSSSRSFTLPYAVKTVTSIRLIENEQIVLVEYGDGEWYEGEFYYYVPTELLGAEITYSDGSTKTVDSIGERLDGVWFETYQNTKNWQVGGENNTLTVRYQGAQAQYNVQLVESPVERITVNSAPTKVYTFGDWQYGDGEDDEYHIYAHNYDLTGISLTVEYTDGSSETFTHEDIEGGEYGPALYVDGYAIGFTDVDAVVGMNTVTVCYLGAEAEYEILVAEPTVKYVQIVKAPDVIPTEYGFTTDSLGMQLKLTYTDNSTKVITVTEDNVSYTTGMVPASIIRDDDTEIRVSYWNNYGRIYAEVSCGSFYSEQLIAEQITSYTIEDIEVTEVSMENASVELKLTFMDGTSQVLALTPAAGSQSRSGEGYIRGVAATDKGLLGYTVWAYSDNDGNIVEYEIGVMEQYLYLEAPEVPDVVVGDADGNGVVDGMDATLLLQYAAGWDVQIDEAAGDADGNGVVDGMDATLLLQYAAGWDVTLGGN